MFVKNSFKKVTQTSVEASKLTLI